MALSTLIRQKVTTENRRHETDSGSPELQIAMLTEKVNALTDHLRTNRGDFNSRRGLIMMVSKRNRLLRYLQRTKRQTYLDVIAKLGLRK